MTWVRFVMSPLNSIDEILDDIRQGRMVVIMDDEDRENEGDLIMAATKVRPEDVNFMARYVNSRTGATRSSCRRSPRHLRVPSTFSTGSGCTRWTCRLPMRSGSFHAGARVRKTWLRPWRIAASLSSGEGESLTPRQAALVSARHPAITRRAAWSRLESPSSRRRRRGLPAWCRACPVGTRGRLFSSPALQAAFSSRPSSRLSRRSPRRSIPWVCA